MTVAPRAAIPLAFDRTAGTQPAISQWRQSSTLRVGTGLLLACGLMALIGPLVIPFAPSDYSGSPMEPPNARHLLGTNGVGQDMLSGLAHGARVSMAVALVAGLAGLVIALLVGVPAGAMGGPFDAVAMRSVDVFMAIPHLPLMIVLAVFLGPGLGNVILVIVALAWVRPARVIRSQVLSLRSRGYIHSARLFGGKWPYLIRRHLLPALAPIAAAAFVNLASRAVVMEAALAFLGIGDPTIHSWGMIMRHALDYRGLFLTTAWAWWLLPPGICLSLLIAGLAMVGTAAEAGANTRLSRHQGAP